MFDPHRKEREDQITKVVKPLISEVLGDMEPPMREGMSESLCAQVHRGTAHRSQRLSRDAHRHRLRQ